MNEEHSNLGRATGCDGVGQMILTTGERRFRFPILFCTSRGVKSSSVHVIHLRWLLEQYPYGLLAMLDSVTNYHIVAIDRVMQTKSCRIRTAFIESYFRLRATVHHPSLLPTYHDFYTAYMLRATDF